jgi:putative NIF3 family GTP cyclohydrolase 1 type 2
LRLFDNSKCEINRRDFSKKSSCAILGAGFTATSPSKIIPTTHSSNFPIRTTLKCSDIAEHFQKIGTWVNWDKTTDTFKAGDPSKSVKKVAVAWKAGWVALREAVSNNADLFISHESICVNAVNGSTEPEIVFALPTEKPKFDWLEKSDLVVYRCHDVWDRFPGEGIRDTWRDGLKIGDRIFADEYPLYVTEIEPMTVYDLALHVLRQIKPLGQNGIMVSGNLKKMVNRVGTGTGMSHNPPGMRALGADIGIMTDDGYKHVRIGVHANELDFPTIFVNHGVTEEWGIKNLAVYIRRSFPDLDVFHIPQYCPYTILGLKS